MTSERPGCAARALLIADSNRVRKGIRVWIGDGSLCVSALPEVRLIQQVVSPRSTHCPRLRSTHIRCVQLPTFAVRDSAARRTTRLSTCEWNIWLSFVSLVSSKVDTPETSSHHSLCWCKRVLSTDAVSGRCATGALYQFTSASCDHGMCATADWCHDATAPRHLRS